MDYSFDCARLEQFNARWDILDSTQQQTLSTLANATELTSLPDALSAGSYVIRINMTMYSSFYDLSDKAVVAYAYADGLWDLTFSTSYLELLVNYDIQIVPVTNYYCCYYYRVVDAYGYVDIAYCQPASVMLNPSAASDQPFSSPEAQGFTVTADISLDCPPMQQLSALWKSSIPNYIR